MMNHDVIVLRIMIYFFFWDWHNILIKKFLMVFVNMTTRTGKKKRDEKAYNIQEKLRRLSYIERGRVQVAKKDAFLDNAQLCISTQSP